MDFPVKVEIRAKASSSYTLETIQRRLEQLSGRQDEAALAEVMYLRKLLAKLD